MAHEKEIMLHIQKDILFEREHKRNFMCHINEQ